MPRSSRLAQCSTTRPSRIRNQCVWVTAKEVYLQLTVDRGWTRAAYHDWLSRTLALLLLA
jgi:hypothetical protein